MLTRDATLLIKVTESSARSNPVSVVPILLMNQRGEEEERGEWRVERGERIRISLLPVFGSFEELHPRGLWIDLYEGGAGCWYSRQSFCHLYRLLFIQKKKYKQVEKARRGGEGTRGEKGIPQFRRAGQLSLSAEPACQSTLALVLLPPLDLCSTSLKRQPTKN